MAAFLLVLAGLAAGAPGQERVIERRFASELQLSTEIFEIAASEEGRSEEQQGPRYEREEAYEAELEDTLSGGEEPPDKFTRFYRTVMASLSLSGAKKPLEKTASGKLEGKRVTFEREGKGRYSRSSEEDELQAGQLRRLRASVSLARFLPPEDAEDGGQSYSIPFAVFERVLSPLEEKPRRRGRKEAEPVRGLNIAPAALLEPMSVLLSEAEGELTVEPRTRGEDDELPHNADLSFRFEGSFDGSEGLVPPGAGEAEDEVEFVYEGTGSLAWDPESGRIELSCRGDLRLSERFTVRVEAGGKQGTAHGRLALSGSLELEASEEPGK